MKSTLRTMPQLLRTSLVLALFSSAASSAQGWETLTNTKLQTVCPPNNFQPAGGGMPSYAFNSLCYGKVTDYSSAAVDTKRNRLVIWGGGHGGYLGNEVYSLDLVAKSAGSATCGGTPCATSTNSSAPTMTRLNDPSVWPDPSQCSTATQNSDGTPITAHTWGAWVYLPKNDKFFQWMGYTFCGGTTPTGPDTQIWLFDAATQKWTNKGTPPLSPAPYSSAGAFCVLDPTTSAESVLCVLGMHDIVRYDVDTNTLTRPIAYNTVSIQTGSSLVVDPDRKLLFSIGSSYSGPSSPDPHIYAIDLGTGQFKQTDWTSAVGGCDDLLGYAYPSVVWDPSLHRIVGYVPRTVASAAPNNQVIVFDPGTKTCTTQPVPGGPPADQRLLNTITGTEQGMFGRFNYVPALGKYVVLNNFATDAYTFTLNANPATGLGSSTFTCVDRDGDGYGTGPGCAGPDADDLDTAVYTGAQFLGKWSTIAAGLQHLGYNPTRIWYVAPNGNDGTGVVNDSTRPFATCCSSGKANPAPGDAVLLRGGTYTFWAVSTPSGTPGHPIVYMSYPGELAYFTPYPAGFDFVNRSFVVVDGLKFYASGGNACVNLGVISNTIIRHVEASGCEWGIDSELPTDLTIEDSVLHDAPVGGGQHGIYLTAHSPTTPGRDIFVRRNLLYNNPYTGFQFNGRAMNLVVEQNIAYNNDTSGFSWLTGVSYSTFRNNVAVNNAQGFAIYQYQSYCDVYDPTSGCPYGEHHNVIENFTCYSTGIDRFGTPYQAGFACITLADDSKYKADMGHNIYRNLNLVNYHLAGYGLGPLNAADAALAYFATSTFQNINVYNANRPTGDTAFTVGTTYYTCAQAASAPSVFGAVSNCTFVDPQFMSASNAYWKTPDMFNLRVQESSPISHAGVPVTWQAYDAAGTALGVAPTLGAYQVPGSATVSVPPSTPATPSACDINRDGMVDARDVQAAMEQALGVQTCGTGSLTQIGVCNVISVQRVIIATRGGACITGI